ncbi:hypothetical protein [Escherichia sp. KTE114]|uniref:hypothetical protein n=1 Tax=Escherichia sp. KTE114 TaxID=1169321 RepID=UPI000334CEAC|nr:hypothetical protein [Escherichia sp. KTE114]EOU42733.1 hypothetical protein WC5_03949 [Escherichia sp. KTE114]
MIDLPFHIKRLRIVTLEQAALVMAGLSGEYDTLDPNIVSGYISDEKASTFKEIICQAIKLKEVIPLKAYTYTDPSWNLPVDALSLVKNDDINIDTHIVDANFLAKDIWPWVENEFIEYNAIIITPPLRSGITAAITYKSRITSDIRT